MPRGPRRNLRPVADRKSAPIAAASTGSWPTDWQASTRYQVSRARGGRRRCAATSLIRPFCDGQWVTATTATSVSSSRAKRVDVDGAVLAVGDELEAGAGAQASCMSGRTLRRVLGRRHEDAVAVVERPGEGDRREGARSRRPWPTPGGRSARAGRRRGSPRSRAPPRSGRPPRRGPRSRRSAPRAAGGRPWCR